MLVTLTVAAEDPLEAQGHIRRFWSAVRRRWPETDYFCWLELQQRGAVHYHAIWLNAPRLRKGLLPAWVEHTWGLGRTQVRWRDRKWVERGALDYVIGYSKKMGAKAYQQAYEDVPSELRTSMNERLGYLGPDLDAHRTRPWVQYLPPGAAGNPTSEGLVQLLGQVEHIVCSVCEITPRERHVPPGLRPTYPSGDARAGPSSPITPVRARLRRDLARPGAHRWRSSPAGPD